MTKRFTIKLSMIVDDVTVIIDNQKEYTFPVLDSTLNYMFCKVLNEQHEQIQELIQSSKELEEDCQSTFNAMSRKQDDLYRMNFKLKEENEQLKSEIRKQSKQCTASIQRFKEENEQLKQEIETLQEQIAHFDIGDVE